MPRPTDIPLDDLRSNDLIDSLKLNDLTEAGERLTDFDDIEDIDNLNKLAQEEAKKTQLSPEQQKEIETLRLECINYEKYLRAYIEKGCELLARKVGKKYYPSSQNVQNELIKAVHVKAALYRWGNGGHIFPANVWSLNVIPLTKVIYPNLDSAMAKCYATRALRKSLTGNAPYNTKINNFKEILNEKKDILEKNMDSKATQFLRTILHMLFRFISKHSKNHYSIWISAEASQKPASAPASASEPAASDKPDYTRGYSVPQRYLGGSEENYTPKKRR